MTEDAKATLAEVLALARKYHEAGRPDQARRVLLAARGSRPDSVDVLSALASLERGTGDMEAAARWMELAVALDPDDPALVGNLGNIHRAAGAFDAAIDCYEKVLEVVPDSLAALNNLGMALRAKDDIAGAIAVYHRALRIDPASLEVLNNLAAALVADGRPNEALALLEEHARQPDVSLEIKATLATALGGVGRVEEAIAILRDILVRRPLDYRFHTNLANALRDAGRIDEAIASYRAALDINPHGVTALGNLAAAYSSTGNAAEAANVLKRAIAKRRDGTRSDHVVEPETETEPGDPRLLEGLAYAHLLLGEDDDARRMYRRVLALDPKAATATHMLDVIDQRTTDAPPPQFVASLFDGYAATFDSHLTAALDYTGPEILGRMLAATIEGAMTDSVLDLGCGTGLMGEALKQRFDIGSLAGVDLSAKMIDQAAAKKIYDTLSIEDVTGYLRTANARFDLITACDVFIYLGDLAAVFSDVGRCLAEGGHFAFTVETVDEGDEGDYRLLRSGRYAHSRRYIESLAAETGLRTVARDTQPLRRDAGRPIMADYVVLRR